MPDFASSSGSAAHTIEGFRLDGWTVRPRAHELVRGAEVVRVEPKPMEVLVCLAARAGHTVTRDELLDAVWPDVFVSESALSRCVSQLRKVFGDDPQAPRVIETIPKAGYRLIAPVTPLAEGDGLAPSFLPPRFVPEDLADADLTVSVAASPGRPPTLLPEVSSDRPNAGSPQRWRLMAGLLVVLAVGFATTRMGMWLATPTPHTPLAVAPFDLEPGMAMSAAWSPDGSRVAYVRVTTDAERPTAALLVRAAADAPPLRLDDGTARVASPAWSPDGTEVAFVRCDADGCRPYAVPALGGSPRRLADVRIGPVGMAWVDDGTALVVSHRTDAEQPARLARLDLETGALDPLTAPPPTGRGDWMPKASRDGRWLAFERHTAAGGEDLYRLDLTDPSASSVRLTYDDADLAGYAWTPDSRALVVSSNRAGIYALWNLDAEAGARGAMTRVAHVPARDPGGPALTDGALVFEEWLFEINLWRYDLLNPEAAPERLVASTLWDMHPHLSPAHRSPDPSQGDARLAFVSNRGGSPEVWLAQADGSGTRRLSSFEGPAAESPRWHPDGQRLVVQTRAEERAVLVLLDAEGGPPTPLTSPEADARHPRWTRDGQHVFFASNREGAWHLWRVAADGGTPERVPGTGGAVVGAEGPDGALLVARYGEPGLWRLDPHDPEQPPEPLVPDLADPLAWAIAGDALVYIARTDAGRRLVRWEPATGVRRERTIAPVQLTPGAPVLTVAPDGTSAVLAQVDQVESDLMRVDGFE